MRLSITRINGKWLVNGKPYAELNLQEQKFMDDFFREVKLNNL